MLFNIRGFERMELVAAQTHHQCFIFCRMQKEVQGEGGEKRTQAWVDFATSCCSQRSPAQLCQSLVSSLINHCTLKSFRYRPFNKSLIAHTHACTHTHAHTRTHTCTHTRTHTHARTHTYTTKLNISVKYTTSQKFLNKNIFNVV